MEKQSETGLQSQQIIIRIVVCLVVLAMGTGGFIVLKKLKKPPEQVATVERPLKVDAVRVELTTVPVIIEGHGELRNVLSVVLAAEVAGKVVQVHPRLQTGEVIEKGHLLFALDDRDYRNEFEAGKIRLKILQRDRQLAEKEYQRILTLFEKKKVGTMAGVEKAEQVVNSVKDREAQVRQTKTRAEISLGRSRILAPFTCRIVSKHIELGQYMAPGKTALTLADDSILEVEVPIDSRDALKWLKFTESPDKSGAVNWFTPLENMACRIRWTEDSLTWAPGVVDRVTSFDPATRMLKVAVRLDLRDKEGGSPKGLPLVAGMFCSVEIPGKDLVQVVVLPRWAVSFENNVYLAEDNRLITRPVTVARVQDDKAYVSDGLEEGQLVIVTRMVAPLERALLQVKMTAGAEKE